MTSWQTAPAGSSVLVVVAHPDDEALGCGGTIARLAAGGRAVHVTIVATAAVDGTRDDRQADQLRLHFTEALACLGVTGGVDWLGYPDQQLDVVSVGTLAGHLRAVVDRYRPNTILTHHSGDLNADHRRVAEAVLVATRPQGSEIVPAVYACEIPSSTEWAFGLGQPFVPNVFVDVTATLDRKLGAMACYATEWREAPHPRAAESLRALARVRGAASGVEYAEAFCLLRELVR